MATGKDKIMQKVRLLTFYDFVDNNSSPNGRKKAVGATYYSNSKFFIIRTPNYDDPQYEFKCIHSVLYKFKRTLEQEGMGKLCCTVQI